MIKNPNYNPEKLEEYRELDRKSRYENGKRRMLVDMRFRQIGTPEGFCTTCKGFTTNYNSRGECEVCGTEVQAND